MRVLGALLYGRIFPEQADCFVQKRMVSVDVATSQQSLLPPYLAQSAADSQGRYVVLAGHCSASVQEL